MGEGFIMHVGPTRRNSCETQQGETHAKLLKIAAVLGSAGIVENSGLVNKVRAVRTQMLCENFPIDNHDTVH
jgi:hypothetical protein